MWDSNGLNNQGQLACSLVMGKVFDVHIAWFRPPVCFGWVGRAPPSLPPKTHRGHVPGYFPHVFVLFVPTLILARLLVRILMPAQRSFSATATCDYMI